MAQNQIYQGAGLSHITMLLMKNQVVDNARTLAKVLTDKGIKIVGGGTDTHMVLLNLAPLGLLGREAEAALAAADITSNKNPVPFDVPRPSDWVGL
jgi:glycine hydroxymethyltransferase